MAPKKGNNEGVLRNTRTGQPLTPAELAKQSDVDERTVQQLHREFMMNNTPAGVAARKRYLAETLPKINKMRAEAGKPPLPTSERNKPANGATRKAPAAAKPAAANKSTTKKSTAKKPAAAKKAATPKPPAAKKPAPKKPPIFEA